MLVPTNACWSLALRPPTLSFVVYSASECTHEKSETRRPGAFRRHSILWFFYDFFQTFLPPDDGADLQGARCWPPGDTVLYQRVQFSHLGSNLAIIYYTINSNLAIRGDLFLLLLQWSGSVCVCVCVCVFCTKKATSHGFFIKKNAQYGICTRIWPIFWKFTECFG